MKLSKELKLLLSDIEFTDEYMSYYVNYQQSIIACNERTCTLYGYLKFLDRMLHSYLKSSEFDSFREFVNAVYPP